MRTLKNMIILRLILFLSFLALNRADESDDVLAIECPFPGMCV